MRTVIYCSMIFPLSLKSDPSSLDHSFSSIKDDLSLCDDPLLPSRKIIGDRGGPASMKENICQVRFLRGLRFTDGEETFVIYYLAAPT